MQPERDRLREEERELDYPQVEKHSTSFQHHVNLSALASPGHTSETVM